MGWFRPRTTPHVLVLRLPLADGSSWPRAARGGGFAAETIHDLGTREAFTPTAHAIAEDVVAALLPHLQFEVSDVDRPHLNDLFTRAAQVGAGIGLIDRPGTTGGPTDDLRLDPAVAAALQRALDSLPPLPSDHREIARFLLQTGHYVARTGRESLAMIAAALRQEDQER